MFRLIFMTAALAGSTAFAQQAPRQIQYQESILPFSEWSTKFPQEKAVMGLFRNYAEPSVDYMENGIKKNKKISLMMYLVRMRAGVNKPAGQIRLADLIKLESIRQLDPESIYQAINASEIMPVTAGRGPVRNFDWCNKINPDYFKLQNYELPMSHLSGQKFCQGNGNTLCVESCYFFTGNWYKAVFAANNILRMTNAKPEDYKDYGLTSNAEVKFYPNETAYGQNLKALTGVETPAKGIVEMNIFYFNQVLQYGKVLAVIYDHPTTPNATMISTFVAMGIRKATWDKYWPLQNAMKGSRDAQGQPVDQPCTGGIVAGIPNFSKCMAANLATVIEKQ